MAKQQQVVSKYKSEEEKRLARNERVRIRRAKQRAAKKASKRATTTKLKKAAKKVTPRRTAKPAKVEQMVTIAPVSVQTDLIIGTNDVSFYLDGAAHTSFEYKETPTSSTIADFVDSLESIIRALGAKVIIHDVRPSK